MFYFDAHCHIQKKSQFVAAQQKQIEYFVVNSTHPNNWEEIHVAAQEMPSIFPCFGVHPWYVNHLPHDWVLVLSNYLSKNPYAMVGEIGLDATKPYLLRQGEVFECCLKLAQTYQRPVHIHGYKAWSDIADILSCYPDTVFLLHQFYAEKTIARRFLEFKNAYFSVMTRRIAAFIPPERLLIESDSPDKDRRPEHVIKTAEKVGCDWKQLDQNFINFISHLPAARDRLSKDLFR